MLKDTSTISSDIKGILNRLLVKKPIVKLFSSLWAHTHADALKHNKRVWPYVRVQRNEQNIIRQIEVFPSHWKINLTEFDEVVRPSGNTAHLILSGPSIKDIDYNQLSLSTVMGVNGSIALQQDYNINFQYYVIIDDSFIRCRPELTKEIVAQNLTLFVRANVVRAIAHYISPQFIKCRLVVFDEVDTPACQARPGYQEVIDKAQREPGFEVFDAERYQGFSSDPRLGLFGARTVAYDALQLLVWLGMKEIYIHGLDMNNASSTPRFYETKDNSEGSTLDRNFKSTIEPSFRNAAAYLRNRGVDVYNLSLNSAFGEDVFPKLSWQKLLQ
jgi:Kdo-III transferase WaaZ